MIDLDRLVLGPCMQAWGESVVFMPVAGPQAVVAGVWSERFKEITFEDGNPVTDNKPVLGCRTADFGQCPQQNDIFQIRGRLWAVEAVEPDGEGHLHLQMRLANDAQRGLPIVPPQPAPTGA